MVKTYERPMLKNVSLRNEETVANTCWGYHAGETPSEWERGQVLYTDLKGDGWASFKIGGKKCSLNLIEVRYHSGLESECSFNGVNHSSTCPGVEATQDQIRELETTLRTLGGVEGNSFSGEGTVTLTPDKPIPSSW